MQLQAKGRLGKCLGFDSYVQRRNIFDDIDTILIFR